MWAEDKKGLCTVLELPAHLPGQKFRWHHSQDHLQPQTQVRFTSWQYPNNIYSYGALIPPGSKHLQKYAQSVATEGIPNISIGAQLLINNLYSSGLMQAYASCLIRISRNKNF